MEDLKYIDSHNVAHHFFLVCEEDMEDGRPSWHLSVWPTPEQRLGTAPYFARFDQLEDGRLQSAVLDNNGNGWARGVELSEAVFGYVAQRTGKTIISSRPFVAGGGEWRTPAADSMWRRFLRTGHALELIGEQRFQFVP